MERRDWLSCFLYLYRIVMTSKTFKLKLKLIDFFIHRNVFENAQSGFLHIQQATKSVSFSTDLRDIGYWIYVQCIYRDI